MQSHIVSTTLPLDFGDKITLHKATPLAANKSVSTVSIVCNFWLEARSSLFDGLVCESAQPHL